MCAHSTGIMQVVQRRHIISCRAGSVSWVGTLSWPPLRRALQPTQYCTENGRLATIVSGGPGYQCWSLRTPSKSHVAMQMLFMRYIIGGQAELSAGETLSIGNIATGQEGGNIARDRVRLVHEYLIDAMQEMKVDKASIAGVACLSAEAKQAKVLA